jgi:hypothetical protein
MAQINRAIGAQPLAASAADADSFLVVMRETAHDLIFSGIEQ